MNNNLLDLTEFYESAFRDYLKEKWKYTAFARDDIEIKNMAYAMFLTAFYFNDENAIANRRRCLYYYLSMSGYDTTKTENIINRMKNTLPVDSFIRRMLNDVCVIYDEPAIRKFSDAESDNKKMADLYEQIKIDVKMQTIYELAKLAGVVAVTMVVRNSKPKLLYMTPDKFRVITDSDDITKVNQLHYIDYDSKLKSYVHHTWTDTEHITSASGTAIINEPNIYGRIPFEFCRITDSDMFFGGGLYEQSFKNLQFNNHMFNSDREAVINGMTQWIAVNMPSSIANRSPDIIHRVDRRNDMDPEPSMTPISTNGLYNDIFEFANNLKNNSLLDFGEPPDFIDTSIGANMSGISRMILHSKLNNIRESDIPVMESFETDLSELIQTIGNADYWMEPVKSLNYSISYAPIKVISEPAIEYEHDKQLMADGLMPLSEFVNKHGRGFDESLTETKIIQIINDRKKLISGTSTPDDDTDDDVVDDVNDNNVSVDKSLTNIDDKINNLE